METLTTTINFNAEHLDSEALQLALIKLLVDDGNIPHTFYAHEYQKGEMVPKLYVEWVDVAETESGINE